MAKFLIGNSVIFIPVLTIAGTLANIMRKILQIIILLTSIMTFSQEKLSGKYCSIPIGESDVTCIDFKKNNLFEYSVSGCLGTSQIGTGIFELKNETLKLKFDKKEQASKESIKITEIKSSSEKTVEFEFIIKDENESPLYVNIVDISNVSGFEISEEKNKIEFEKKNLKVKYRILSLGYASIELELEHNSSKKIEITMYPVQAKVISEKVFEWNLTELNENEFKVGTEIWNTFKKTK
ncbi:hypothetical protein [Tenacibaculum finnmarkense]|uniref:hypothetical protein n=2 Tax=Tenacibaculum finnmarkense TaxID=2781243 RepID=UPI001EFB15B2|nr:hypothetical protein [Tenacibaculum finnmarkense]MCG8755531.1 hypothetical protein [Tenacibaculum finnmarkense]MCG8784108.1 hypothetical protein [Tenacibaculum finnmarkense]